jgi:uncharacterized protein (TIGR02466 family)
MKWQAEASWKALAAIEQLAKQELSEEPDSVGHWTSLINVQKRFGRGADIQASLDQAQAAFGNDPQGRKDFLTILSCAGEGDRAVLTAEALVDAAPDDADAHELLARAIANSDRWGDAEERAYAKIAGTPHARMSLNQAWKRAETDEDVRAFVARCRAALLEDPIHTDARCFLAHALARLCEEAEARAVMAMDALVSVGELPPPTGYASCEQFRAALAAEIRQNPTLAPDPKNKATRDGRQTAALGLPGEPAVAVLVGQIKAAVEAYLAARMGSADPFITSAPEVVRITQWAVIYGAAGHQTPHRHPSGWLSGVYYVSAPHASAVETAGGDGYLGALLVGAPQAKVATPPPWGIRRIEPLPGRLVLFPSYVSHGTEACGAEGERISVAFDVTPAARGPA